MTARRFALVLLTSSLLPASIGAEEEPPSRTVAPPASLALVAPTGATLPPEYLTLPALARDTAPPAAAAAAVPATHDPGRAVPATRAKLSFDADRSRPRVPQISDGDRDRALLVRVRVPF